MAINLNDKINSDESNKALEAALRTNELLTLILQELQVMNGYNAELHDEPLTIEDIEDEYN